MNACWFARLGEVAGRVRDFDVDAVICSVDAAICCAMAAASCACCRIVPTNSRSLASITTTDATTDPAVFRRANPAPSGAPR